MPLSDSMKFALREWCEQWSRAGVSHLKKLDRALLSDEGASSAGGRAGENAVVTPVVPSIDAPASPEVTHPRVPPPNKIVEQPIRPLPTGHSPAQGLAPPPLHQEASDWGLPSHSHAEREEMLAILAKEVQACKKCTELACTRKQTVFGVGNASARIAFFGEAPGADEDRMGIPFVGRAGQLLDKIIVASKLKREDVYILNSLRCRPPGNRTPTDSEIEACRPFFEKQLAIVQPDYIVCLGSVAVRAILKTTETVGRLRGRFHSYRKAKVLVTYHPAYLLRNESAKKLTWEDMQILMKELGLPIPSK